MEISEFNKSIIEEFRANGGKVAGQFAGAPLLLLTTIGAKTGRTRVNPLAYLEEGDRYVIIASYAGADHNPPWYHNLLAHPDVTIEVGTERIDVRADAIPEPQRTELYRRMASIMPPFSEYEHRTTRKIPVIALTRR